MTTLPIPTAEGTFFARYSEHGLTELHFPGPTPEEDGEETGLIREWHRQTTGAVVSILNGLKVDHIAPLDLSGHTAFRLRVWEQLQRIPVGETASYAEVAAAIGQPGATRAVGGACGANPIPLIIPCHRVVRMEGENRSLGGYSGGLNWKGKLLALEGVVLEPDGGQKQEVLTGFQSFFERCKALTSRKRSGKSMVRMEIRQKAKIAVWSVALLVAAPVAAGEKVQITGSTSIELPKPTHILEDAKRVRAHDGPSGRSEMEGGVPPTGPLPNSSPQLDKKLLDAIDKKKNWIFVNPYESQFDSRTEQFLKGERGTGLYNHRLMKEEDKGVVERFVQERNSDRETELNRTESSNNRNDRDSDKKHETLRGLREEVLPGDKSPASSDAGFSLAGTLEPKSELYNERTDFQKRLERSPFNESLLGTRPTERGGMTIEEREARDAELGKIYQPRVTAAPAGGGTDPVNRSFDATRQEATPFSARRSEQMFNVGRGEGNASAGRNSPVFAGSGIGSPGGLDPRASSRSDFSDFGSRAPSSFAPSAAVAPAPSSSAAFNPAPFVLPRPNRKF